MVRRSSADSDHLRTSARKLAMSLRWSMERCAGEQRCSTIARGIRSTFVPNGARYRTSAPK